MKHNPVFKRETMVSSRSIRMVLVILFFNGILAAVALLNMYSNLQRARLTAEIQYSAFLDLYLFVAVLEFLMVIFITPALTSGSISGEYEKRTLDIMLTTKLTPRQIVGGKMMAALATMGMLIVSSLPVLALVFVYGGLTLVDIALLFLSFMAASLLMGGLGICCSAVLKRTTLATVTSYVCMGVMVLGTYGVNLLYAYINRINSVGFQGPESGRLLSILLLLNPAHTFVQIIERLSGRMPVPVGMAGDFAFPAGVTNASLNFMIGAGLVIQVVLGIALTMAAVEALKPGRQKENKKLREKDKNPGT